MAATRFLSFREQVEIGVSVSAELSDLILDGKVTTCEIRETLKVVAEKEGIGHPDAFFIEKVSEIFRNRFGF